MPTNQKVFDNGKLLEEHVGSDGYVEASFVYEGLIYTLNLNLDKTIVYYPYREATAEMFGPLSLLDSVLD